MYCIIEDKLIQSVKKNITNYIWEDVFWRRKHEHIEWLEKEIRL